MNKIVLLTLLLSLTLVLADCDSNENGDKESNTPVLSSLSPSSCVSHMPAFILTANGSKFDTAAKIVFDNKEMETTFVSSTEVSCQVGTADCSIDNLMPYGQERNITVLVRNPSTAGGDSNNMTFRVDDEHKFTAPVNISNTPKHSTQPDIAVAKNGNLYVVWECENTGISQIFFSSSTNTGASWSTPKNISNIDEYSDSPAIGIDAKETLYVAWCALGEIYFSSSENKGSTWSQPLNLTESEDGSVYPEIAIDSLGNIDVVWFESDIDNYCDVRFRRSTDGGHTWSNITRIGPSWGFSEPPAVATDCNGNICIIWSYIKNNIYFSCSTDGGQTWSKLKQVSRNKSITNTGEFSLSINAEGIIYAFWTDDFPQGNYDIFFSKSEDNGENWTEPVNFTNTPSQSGCANIVIDTIGNLNFVYCDSEEIFYCRSIDKGTTWSPIQNISNSGIAVRPSIGLDEEGNIYIVWDYYTYAVQVYFSRNLR